MMTFVLLLFTGHLPDYEDSGEESMDITAPDDTGKQEDPNMDKWASKYLDQKDEEEEEAGSTAGDVAVGAEKEEEIRRTSTSTSTVSTAASTGTGSAAAAGVALPRLYYTVNAERKASNASRTLAGVAGPALVTGSFVREGENRVMAVPLRSSYTKKMNMSSSFNLETLQCVSCDPELTHPVLMPAHQDGEHVNPAVFVLADQHFPAFVPAYGEGECLKILRIEDTGPIELAQRFLEVVKGFSMPAGSVVLVTALSHLIRRGAQQYCYDLRVAFKMMASAFGRAVKLMHGTPVPCIEQNEMAIRACLEVDSWLASCAPKARLELASGWLQKKWTSTQLTASGYEWVGQWPSDLHGSASTTRISSGFGTYSKVPAFTEAEEDALLKELIKELNSKMAAGLCLDISTKWEVEVCDDGGAGAGTGTGDGNKTVYIVVGASHASRMAEELEEAGQRVIYITKPGWKPTRENVQQSTVELRKAVQANQGRTLCIVFQLLDNSVYLARKDGAATLPVRLQDGHYHVVGQLEMLGSDGVKDILHNILPLLKAGEDHRKVVIAPVQRYVPAPCCEDPGHITNYRDKDYFSNMAANLKSIREMLRSFISKRNVKNYRVVSGEKLLGWEEGVSASSLRALWGEDPVHLATAGYRAMAAKIREMMESEVPFTNSGEAADDTQNRASWIRKNEASAIRIRGGGRVMGGGRGRGRWGPYKRR